MVKIVWIVRFILIIWALCALPAAYAATTPWITTEQSSVRLIGGGYNDQHQLVLGVEFHLEPGWKVYWKNPGDSGIPVSITPLSPSPLSYTILWPLPSRIIDEVETIHFETYAYSHQVLFPIIVSGMDATRSQDLTFTVHYGICNAICIPGQSTLSITIPAQYHNAALIGQLETTIASTPQPNGTYGMHLKDVTIINSDTPNPLLQITARHEQSFRNPNLLLDGKEGLMIHAPRAILSEHNQFVTFQAPLLLSYKDALKSPNLSVVIVDNGKAIEVPIDPDNIHYATNPDISGIPSGSSYIPSFYWIVTLAFLGGLILNLMPCVLPVLSIKLLSVIGLHHQRRLHISSGFICTALGIITSFTLLAGMLIALKAAGMQAGWGFQFQQPYFLVFLIVVLTLFAASMWDILEIQMPAQLHILTKTVSNRYLNHFLMGCFATLLATPCSAPFLGTASGFALSQSSLVILEIFTIMGIGMATPYLVLALFPSLVYLLPKPGKWMVYFKYFMGLLLALTACWLLWVLSLQWGVSSSLMLFGFCILLFFSWLLPRYQKRVIAALVLAIFTIPAIFTTSPLMPESDRTWIPFDETAISDYVSKGKVVFIDITAAWCLTCKVNKYNVLNRSDTHTLFETSHVITMQADWTNRNPAIQPFLMRHQRAGIPFNIVYGPRAPHGILLPELLTYKSIVRAIEQSR